MRSLLAVLVFVVCSTVCVGGWVVHFDDGRSMRVDDLEPDGSAIVLTLEGGGTLAIPSARVSDWFELAIPAHEPVPESVAHGSAPPWQDAAGAFAELIGFAAERHALDPALLTAVAEVESAFDPTAVSSAGACGLMQLMPQTAERFGVRDVFDVEQNVEGGARYLSWLLERFEGDTELALAGYNAGEGAVDRHRGIPPYRETRQYVSRVLQGAGRLSQLAP